MDPYYRLDLSLPEEPLKEPLQKRILSDHKERGKEEAMHLLPAYAEGSFGVKEDNMEQIPEK